MINRVEIYNPSLTLLTTYFDFISCIWTTQYFAPGEFELVVEYSPQSMAYLTRGNFVVKNGGSEIAVIEKVRYSYTPDEGGTITASGRMAISLLDRRLIYSWNTNTNKPNIVTYCARKQRVEKAVRNIVSNEAINPVFGGSIRQISNLILGTDMGYTEKAKKRVSTYKNLYQATTSLLAVKNMAHRIVFDAETKKLVYQIFKGTDRSGSMVFSRQRQNLLSFAYEIDDTEWKNLYYIGGNGEGTDRFVTTFGNGAYSNNERREVFYSASSDREENETAADYAEELQAEAQQECRELAIHKTVEAEIDLVGSGYEFGLTYNVGDTILIEEVISFKPRITTVIESQSAEGYTVNVEFNEDAPEEEEE